MANWFHRLFNPHCLNCMDDKVCSSCEILKHQLEIANIEKQRLLDTIIRLSNPIQEIQSDKPTETKPILPRFTPWPIKRQMLEEEDRAKARVIRETEERERNLNKSKDKIQEDIENLEKELLIPVEPLKMDGTNAS